MNSSSNLKVCVFSYYFPPHFSGAGLQSLSLAKELRKQGIQFIFVTVDNSGLPRRDMVEGFEVIRIKEGEIKHGEFALWWNLLTALNSLRNRFDIIHASGSTYRNCGVGPIARLLGKKSLTVVSMANNDLYPIGRTTAGRLQAYFLGFVDRYVALSRQITNEIHNLPLDSKRAVEIPQGVDSQRFYPASAAEKNALRIKLALPEAPIVLYTGVLDSRKNVKWLVETWSKHRHMFTGWRLLLVGPTSRDAKDANLREQLVEFGQKEGLQETIMFRDFTPRIEDYYRAADLFVLPSHNEGMPNVVVEAMSCGIPCVVTRISGTTDLITHGQSGTLFDVNDEETFVSAVKSLMRDAGRRSQIGRCAALTIRERFSVEKIADRYLNLYQEMLAEG